MKTDDKDMLHVLSGIDEKLIEEADPYGAGAAGADQLNKAAYVGGSEDAGKTSRGKWLRPAMGIAAAAAVVAIGIVIMKLGVPTAKPGKNERPGTTATPTMKSETTATPTQGVPETTPTPTPTTEPAYTPTPTPTTEPAYTPTPTLTPGGKTEPVNPLQDLNNSFTRKDKHSMSQAEVMTSGYYRYFSPELLETYSYSVATKWDDNGYYELVIFTRKNEVDYSIVAAFVRTKDNTVNYESRVVSASEVSVYDVRGREDPTLEKDSGKFNSAECSPIFRAEEFTDEVMERRIVHYKEDDGDFERMWFAVDVGEYVIEYYFNGILTEENAALFVPAEGAGPDYNPNEVPVDKLPRDPVY